MFERLKHFRKALGYNQTQMGAVLNVKQNTYSLFESGKRSLMERHIQLMVERCGLNKKWLETGEGSMFIETEDERRLVELYDKLCPENQAFLLKYARMMLELEQKENS